MNVLLIFSKVNDGRVYGTKVLLQARLSGSGECGFQYNGYFLSFFFSYNLTTFYNANVVISRRRGFPTHHVIGLYCLLSLFTLILSSSDCKA